MFHRHNVRSTSALRENRGTQALCNCSEMFLKFRAVSRRVGFDS